MGDSRAMRNIWWNGNWINQFWRISRILTQFLIWITGLSGPMQIRHILAQKLSYPITATDKIFRTNLSNKNYKLKTRERRGELRSKNTKLAN